MSDLDRKRRRKAEVDWIPVAQANVAREAAAIIACDPDDPTLASWVRVITVAAVKAGWIPARPADAAPESGEGR